ncbi:MAG: hypothetical protein U0703_00655 [Anaerolineae bacterium]
MSGKPATTAPGGSVITTEIACPLLAVWLLGEGAVGSVGEAEHLRHLKAVADDRHLRQQPGDAGITSGSSVSS